MAREVPLVGGQAVLVDDEDFERVSALRWRLVNGYPARTEGSRHAGIRLIYLHRWLLDAPIGVDVDHANRNRLDARRSVNLRLCDRTQNNGNSAKTQKRLTSSRFKGVCFNKQTGSWKASISISDRSRHLGLFESEVEAAMAYDEAARRHFGGFALTNFPIEQVRPDAPPAPAAMKRRGVA